MNKIFKTKVEKVAFIATMVVILYINVFTNIPDYIRFLIFK